MGFSFRGFALNDCLAVALCCLVACLQSMRCLNTCLEETAKSTQNEKLYYLIIRIRDIEFMDIYLVVVIVPMFPKALTIFNKIFTIMFENKYHNIILISKLPGTGARTNI